MTFPLCANLLLPLAATFTIFKATLYSNSLAPKDKEQVAKAGNYLAKQLATIAMLLDKSMLIMLALYDAILNTEVGREGQVGTFSSMLPVGLFIGSYSPSWWTWMGTSAHTLLC